MDERAWEAIVGAIPCGQYISMKGKAEKHAGKTGRRRGAMHGAQGDGSTPQAGAMHCAPTPISPSPSPSLKCIDPKGSSYSHQLKAGCSVAPPQAAPHGQPP